MEFGPNPLAPFGALCLALLALAPEACSQQKDLYDQSLMRTFKLTFTQNDWWTTLRNSKQSETYMKADLEVDGKVYKDVGIRTRGGSAYSIPNRANQQKLPFKISMDEFVPDQALLGEQQMILNGGFWDPTFVREMLALKIVGEYLHCPKANFIKLVMNNENWGVYVIIQPANGQFVLENFGSNNGNRYKGNLTFRHYGTLPSQYQNAMALTSAQQASSYQDIIKATATMNLPLSQRLVELPKLIDVDIAHKTLAYDSVSGNGDTLPLRNYYVYTDPYHEQLLFIPWDKNAIFWNTNRNFYSTPRLFSDSSLWQRRYQGHMRTMLDRYLDWKIVGPIVTAWQAKIDAEVQADSKKLYSYDDFKNNLLTTRANIGFTTIDGLKFAIDGRRAAYLNMAFGKNPRVTLGNPTRTPLVPTHKETILITVQATATERVDRVILHHRSRGYWQETQMFDDGQHGDGKQGDGIYGITIPAQGAGTLLEYYFSGEADPNSGGDINFLPYNTGRNPFSVRIPPTRESVVISEFLTQNVQGLKDTAGDNDDWIEIFNPTSAAVDMSGKYLSDTPNEPTKWQFPQGTSIPAGGRLLVWADEEPTEGKYHANFKLDGKGEAVALIDKDGATALDLVIFADQKDDVSTGDLFDKTSSARVTLLDPTPNAANELVSCGTRRFSVFDKDTQYHPMDLWTDGPVKIANTFTLNLKDAPANSLWLLQISSGPAYLPLPGLDITSLIAGPALAEVMLPTDGQGKSALVLKVPDQSGLVDAKVTLQGISHDKTRFLASNGLEIRICNK